MRLFQTGRFHFLQPLAYMAKDCIDTFKQYKSSYYVKRDFLQPYHGIVNILQGCKNIGYGVVRLKGGLIAVGITEIYRGLTRFAATPLTWFIRMPLRGLITVFTGFQKAESGSGIQNAVSQGKVLLKDLEGCNSLASEIETSHKSRAVTIKRLTEAQQLACDPVLQVKEAGELLISTDGKFQKVQELLSKKDQELQNLEAKFKKLQTECLSKANELAETIQRKYRKALLRDQRTDLNHTDVKPLTVVKNESNKFEITPFFEGLRLFDSDKSERNQSNWSLKDDLRQLEMRRP